MAEKSSVFPDSVELNGADCFLLHLDKMMWSSSQQRNVCTFVVTLEQSLELNDLKHSLLANAAYQWVCRLRLRKGLPFSLVKWVYKKNASLPKISKYQLTDSNDVPESLLATALNLNTQAAFKVDLVQRQNKGSLLVFTWHHILMDAHGGEAFIRYLGSSLQSEPKNWIADKTTPLPLKKRADIAQAMKQFLYDTSELPLLSLYRKSPLKPVLRYRVLHFSKQHTEQITQNAQQQGAGFLHSAFYLAATSCSVAAIQQQRSPLNEDMLVPVPLDRRLRGADTPIIGNQVTFLFYRLPKQVLSNTQACTLELIEQMKKLMRSDNPNHYVIMMDFLRRIPAVFYRMMLKAPTKGLMASFFYSDTGDLFQSCDELFGSKVNSAVHYPPNLYSPGMTFVFSRFQGALQLTFSYMESVINEQEVEQLLATLSATLLGNESN